MTEEAKDEVKDMGEDIDDFVVRTKSKTDQIIRDYTAVASNAYKGVSVLDANGNLRDTYDILLDISKIYKEIQDEDKKNGTNRAQALVETLAGKTRSNIAASILLNGDVLEDVYNASANDYEGSAQRENEKYLDSIEGRVARLQNRLQELAFTSFAANDIKPIITFLTDAVGLATTLVDKIGLLPALIGSIGGAVLQYSGLGLFGKNGGTGFSGIIPALKQNKFFRQFGELKLNDVQSELFNREAFLNRDGAKSLININEALSGSYGELTARQESYFLGLQNQGVKMVGVVEAQNALSDATFTFGSVMKGVSNIAAGFVSTLATMGVTMLAAFAMQAVIKGISDFVHHSENLINAGEEAKSTMSSVKQSMEETKESISGLSDEYAKLSTGVTVNGSTVKNLNLSEEEFTRYIELSNQIAQIAPELVTGYDNQGNAIVNLGNTIDDVNGKFEEYIRIQETIANGEYGKNLDSMWEGAEEQASKYRIEIGNLESQLRDIVPQTVDGKTDAQITRQTKSFSFQTDAKVQAKIEEALASAGVLYNQPYLDVPSGLTTFNFDPDELAKLSDKQLQEINAAVSQTSYFNKADRQIIQAQQAKARLLLEKAYSDQIPYIQDYVRTNGLFDLIDDQDYAEGLENSLVNMLANVDYPSISSDVASKGGLRAWLDEFMASFLIDDTELRDALSEFFDLQEKRATMTYKEYAEQRNQLFDTIAEKTGYDFYDLAVFFGEAAQDEEGIHWKTRDRITSAAEKLNVESLGYSRDDFSKELQKYDSEYSDAALSAIENIPQGKVSSIAKSWESVWEYLKPYLTGEAVIKKEDPTDTLSQVFNADGFDVSKYTSKLSAVETALSSLYENGFLSDQEKVTLQDALPDLSDFDAESIKKAGGNVLKEYIKYIRDEASKFDLTEDAQRDLDTYVANLAKSYATSISSNSDMFKVLHDSVKAYVDENAPEDWTPRLIESETDQQYKDIISALGDRLSSEDAATIMFMLDADGTLAEGNIQEIVDKWDEYKIQLGITLNDEEEARIKRELQHLETAQGLSDAMISSAEANGGRASKGQRQQAYELARQATREAEKYTQTKFDDYSMAIGSGDEGYISSMWDLVLQARTDEEQKRQAEAEALKAFLESDANGLFEEEERLETEAGILQTQREHEEKFDGAASESTLKAIQKNDEDRQKNAKALADFFTELAESDEYPQFSKDFIKSAADYLSKAFGFESDVFDDAMQHHQNAINALNDDLSRVQAQAQATSDALSLAEAQGRETTAADYQRQIDDAENQIAVLIKQRREQLAIQRDLQGQEGTQEYKDAQAEVENLTSQIRQLQVEQVNAQKAMGEIPMLHLQADQTSLEEASQSLQDELSDPRNAPTVSVYVDLIANADDQISNLEQQRAELQRKMAEAESRQDFSVYDTDYVEYRSRLAEVDSQIRQVTQSQLEWRKAILEMPLDKINQQLEEYEDKLSRISAARELSEASGRATTEKDYLAEAQAYEGEASLHHRASILRGLEAARLVSSGHYSIDSEEVRSVMSQRNQEYTAWMSSRTSALQSRRTADELNLGRIQDQIGLLEQSASQLNDVISLAEARGQAVGALDYQRLIGNADAQIAQNEQLISEYESLMAKWTPEQGSEIWKTYVEGIDNATSQITQLQQSQVEWHDTIMQLGLTDLQNEQADLERQITVAEQEHHKVSEKTYRDLLKNGERQIKNLRAQQRGLDKMEPKYREIQSQIDQVSDSMREWENTADHLAAVAGQNLSSAITSAMSEINSETGLTRETMDSLLQSFDDLTAYDLSGLFYESADGMKLNVGMAQDLIDAQYELTMSGYEKTIAEQNKIIAENTGLQDENAQAALAAAQRRKLAAEQDMAMYQAQYNAQRDALSPFQAWQNATQTKNAGANYETYQGAWEGIKEAYEKGWTNTDDFKTYVAFFDRWGRGTLQAYEDEKEIIKRYITEDDSGVFNFMDDLVAKGLGRMDEDGHYLIDTTSFEEMGEATNMSADAAEMMFGRAKDRGFITYAARTVQEAQLDMVDTTHSLIEETSRYQQMLADGASTEQLEEQRQVIDDLRYTMGGYKDVIGDLSQSYGKITSSDLQTSINQIEALRKLMTDEELTSGMSDGELAKYQEDIIEEIQRIADETGIPLKVNAEGEIDMDKLQEQFDGFKPKITIDEITDESFTNARKELTEIPSLTEAAEGVLGVGENDLMGSAFTKFQEGWEDNKESLGDYIDQLNGLNLSQEAIDNIETLDFADGGYTDGLEEFESILDNVAKMFGITADEAQYLLPILEALGLVNITGNAQTWTKPISAIMGTEVGALDSWIRENENAEVDLDFDPTEMSVDELGEKIKEISKLKVQIDADPEAGDEVKTQYRELMHSLTQQYGIQKKVDRMYQMTGLTADDFLGLNEDDQKRVMVDIGVNPEDYDSFIESAQNQSIKVKIEGALKDGQTVEDLLAIEDDTEFADALGIDEDSVDAAREMLENISMEPYKTAGQTIADQIEDKSSSIGSKIGTGFIEAVTGFIDLLTGGDEEASTTSYNTLPKSTADTTSYQPDDNHAPLPQAGQGSTIVDKHVTELSVEGAHESEAEVADYTKTIEEIPESKKTTITTTKEEINRTTSENNVVSKYKMSSSDLMNNDINKKTQESGGTINVSVNVQGKEQVDALKQSIDDIEGKNVDVRASVYGIGTVSTLNNQISKVTGKDVSINASVNGFALVSGLVSKINDLKDKTVTITTEHKTVMTRGELYTGSVTGTPYTAHASGTAYNMLNLTPKTEANAAGNDVSIQKTGKSLVNELGQESIIRDGKWYLLPGGMHVETLKKGDIVLNHLQTDALLHNRIAPGTGELYGDFEDVIGANAGGTLGTALMGAHPGGAKGPGKKGTPNGKPKKDPSPPPSSGVGNGKTGDGKSKGKGNDKAKTTLDAFKEWLEKLFDWIEVRVERLQYDIDLYQAKAENAIGYGGKHGKNSFINKAMNVIGKLGNVNEKTGKVNSKGSGLLFSAQRGAIRYQQQADQVYDKAVKGGLISKKDANVLVKKIQEGVININEYGETKREFISAYKEWYDKGQELTAQIEELKQQLKELEQTKLDNITEQFEGLVGYQDALNSAAKATIDYYEMVGNEVNGVYTTNQVKIQYDAQKEALAQLKKEYVAYNKELTNAKKVFGANSVEYKAAQTELVNIRQSYVEAKTALKELAETVDRLDISRLDLYIDRLKEVSSRLSNVVSYGEARGTKVGESVNPFLTEGRYTAQVNNNNTLIQQYQAEIDKQNALIKKYGYQRGSNKYNEAYQVIEQAQQEILSLAATNEQLQNSINELRWKPFTELQQNVKNLIGDVDYLRGLMGEGEFFNTDATITKHGYANIALLGDSLMNTKQLTKDYTVALDVLQKEYKNGTISLEEFNDKSRDYVELIKSSVTETKNYEKALIEMYKTQITMENDILQKNIDLRQKALQTKKSYYDYDKQIKDKSKDIITLQAQIAALSGVTNQAGVAERQRLMAQLQQAQEELQDTQYNHRVDTINQGYESLSEDAQKNLDDELEALERNADEQERVVNAMLDKIKESYSDAYKGINSIIEDTGVTISNSAQQGITSIKDLIAEIEKLKESASATSLITVAKADSSTYTADKAVSGINTSATVGAKSGSASTNTNVNSAVKAAASATGSSKANTQAEKNAKTNVSVTNPNKDLTDAVNAQKAKEAADKKAAEDKKKAQEAAKKKKEADNKKKLNNIIAYIKSWKNAKSGVSMKGKHPLYKYIYEGGLNGKRDKLKGATPARQLKIGQLLGMTNLPKDASKLTKAQKDEILKKLKAVGYAQGTKSLEEDDGRYWTHEGELIIRKSDGAVLTPMTKGSTVIPANLADNLFKWGAIDPDKFISNPFMRKKEDVKSVYEQAQPTNVQIGSLFTIQGNVDSGVMDRLEDLGKALTSNKNFQQNVVNLVTKEYVRESRKLGMR